MALSGNGMGANVGKNLAESLAKNAFLREVDLSGNNLGVATAEGGDPSNLGLALGHGLRR